MWLQVWTRHGLSAVSQAWTRGASQVLARGPEWRVSGLDLWRLPISTSRLESGSSADKSLKLELVVPWRGITPVVSPPSTHASQCRSVCDAVARYQASGLPPSTLAPLAPALAVVESNGGPVCSARVAQPLTHAGGSALPLGLVLSRQRHTHSLSHTHTMTCRSSTSPHPLAR